ncbi:hypothetical protein [Myroides fluvii]|uniref:hypothetical protein n=1 Tax=Myroides fluvii TaxID=2572594 RepID=UPI00131CCD23|nr:hypothetical protein [Myroides fluvii]
MIKPIQYEAVNWVDGMKISKRHFDAQTNFMLDSMRDIRAAFCPAFSYGFLPLDEHNSAPNLVEVLTTITGNIELVIKKCNAITPSGFRIAFDNLSVNLKPLLPQLGEELKEQKSTYYLLLSINPFDRIPHGVMDGEETPPRYPFTKPNHRVELFSVKAFEANSRHSDGDYVVIGKLSIHGELMHVEESYIPPCTSVTSHPVLLRQYDSMVQILPMLENYAIRILQREINAKQNNGLVSSVKLLCQALIHDIGSAYFYLRNVAQHLAPLHFIACFSQMATHLYQVTKTLSSVDLEELLNYISEWSEIAPHRFLSQLTKVAEIKYQHTDCESHLREMHLMVNSLEKVFLKLSELDYIGQRKENIIVNELEVTPVSKNNRGWSVLD